MYNRLGFIILHYNAIKETLDCVQSIMNRVDTEDYYIIIVDNFSPNQSGEKLVELYSDSSKITVICNDSNLGFARGNNIGYQYAKNVLHCDFICIMNNDTLLIQDNFFEVIKKEYEISKFGVLGPRIILKNEYDNFLYVKLPSKTFLQQDLKFQKRNLFLMKWHLDHFVTAYKLTRNFVFKLMNKKVVSRYGDFFLHGETKERHEDLILHGCCLVFSPNYIQQYEDAFNPNTFLYCEEELLYLRCKQKNLKMIYNPNLLIKHLEDAATDTIVKKSRQKVKFQIRNRIASLQVLLNEMSQNEM